jgi:hypothetical protein
MPRAQALRSFSFPGHSLADQAAAVEFTGTVGVEKDLPAVGAAQTGTLTTRTDDNTGVATLSTGHGIVSTDVVDVYWSGGVRYGMVATVSTNAVSLEGGAGDNLPAQSTPVTVVKQTAVEVNFDGDTLKIIGIFYRNTSDTGAKAHLDLQDAGDATIKEVDLVHETANGGCSNIWNIEGGDTNVFSGNRITHGAASHDSASAGKLLILAGINS